MILKSNKVIGFFSAIILFIICSTNIFAINNGNEYDEANFKSKEEIDKGISTQLEFLINTNNKNNEAGKSNENWYVYIVGEDSFNPNLFEDPSYIENQLDLGAIGLTNTPLNISKLNENLVLINKTLLAKKLPLIYYGVANRKKAIPAPYFPFEGKFNSSLTNSKANDLFSYYFNKSYGAGGYENYKNLKNIKSSLGEFYKNEKDAAQAKLLKETLAKSGETGAIALSTYYLALIKRDDTNPGKAKLLWWSFNDYKTSSTYFDEHPIEIEIFKKHLKGLSNSGVDKNNARINAWYNYLIDADVPESEFLTDILEKYLNNPYCENLTTTRADQLKKDFIAKITSEDKKGVISFLEQLCPSIVQEVDYTHIIKAINLIASESINEKGEATVLALMYGIKSKDYGSFFADLKAGDNALLNTLFVQMDDASINPFDKNHYSSFIGQLLYIGNQNNGEYLKKERVTLIEALLNYKSEISDFSIKIIDEPLVKLLSFNLSADESGFEDYLAKDGYKKMLEFIALFTDKENKIINDDHLQKIGDSWGQFFAGRNNNKAFIKLLDIAFFDDGGGFLNLYEDGAAEYRRRRSEIRKIIFRMFGHVPDNPNELYAYLTKTNSGDDNLATLKKIIKASNSVDYNTYGNSFYNGFTKILDSQGDIKTRLEIVKWAIDDDDLLNGVHENMIVNIFKNIESKEDKRIVYNFLTLEKENKLPRTKNYHYFKLLTSEGVLSGSSLQPKFVKFFISLIKDGIGNVEDRIQIVKQAIEKGDDWSMLWFSNDSEDIISIMFSDLAPGDAEYILAELKGENGDYELFRNVWKILQSVNLPDYFNTNNSQLTDFVTGLYKILKLSKGQVISEAAKYEEYYNSKHDYLNSDSSKLPKIEGNYIPMVRSNFFSFSGGHNKHHLNASIDSDTSGKVNIDLTIGDNKILDKSFDPFEYVFIEFLEDTKVNAKVKFSAGNLIGVPAFYLAWMQGCINADQRGVAAAVALDAAVVTLGAVTLVASGGTLSPLFIAATGAEMVFAGLHIPVTIYKDEAKEYFGEDVVFAFEIAYLISGISTVPFQLVDLPKDLVKLKVMTKNKVESIISLTQNTKLAAGDKIMDITINIKEVALAMPKILEGLKNNPNGAKKRAEMFKIFSDMESHMRTKMANLPGGASADFIEAYREIFTVTKAFYTDKIPKAMATVISKIPSDRLQISIENKLLTYIYNGKTILGIDAKGVLHHVKKYKDAENYTDITGEFTSKVKLDNGEEIETTIVAAQNDKKEFVFKTKGDIAPRTSYLEDGYVYIPEKTDLPGGGSFFSHSFQKEGKIPFAAGTSTVSKDGVLINNFTILKDFRRKGISKAIYDRVLQENITSISSNYQNGNSIRASNNYDEFMKVYNASKNEVAAALATPQGKVLGNDWKPINIEVKGNSVDLIWVRKNVSNNTLIDDLVDAVDQDYKAILKSDLEDSEGLVQLLNDNSEAIDGWKSLIDFPNLRKDVRLLETYKNVKRLGSYSNEIKPTKIADLTKTHGAPLPDRKANFPEFKNTISSSGYTINEGILVVQLPDGTKLVVDGHHRLKAMEDLGQEIIPARIMNVSEYAEEFNGMTLASMVEIAKLSDNYKGTYTYPLSSALQNVPKNHAIEFMNKNFPGWKKEVIVGNPTFDPKELNDIVLKRFDDYYDDLLTDAELMAFIQKDIKNSNLPDVIKLEIEKIDEITALSNVLRNGDESLFKLASSSDSELVNYTASLINSRRTYKIVDYKNFKHAINNAESVYKLPAVNAKDITNGSGGLGTIFAGDYKGKPAVFKFDRTVDYDAIGEIETVVKGLEGYGGPKFYGRVRVKEINGVWKEAVAIERIEGYDVMALQRLEKQGLDLPIEVTDVHLKAIDDIVDLLKREGNILTETNLGDFMLTNDPKRPVVLLDMFVGPGTSKAQGLLDHNNIPVRNSIEALIIKKKIKALNTSSYKFEQEGYKYVPRTSISSDGVKIVKHDFKKEGGLPENFGNSILTPDGEMETTIKVPENLREKGVSKAIYKEILNEDVKSISSSYFKPQTDNDSQNYTEFMKAYDANNNNEIAAALTTPQGKVIGNEWKPSKIEIKDSEIHIIWVKKGTVVELGQSEKIIERIRKFNPDCN